MIHKTRNSKLKIVFMGTPDFAVPALKALINSPHEVICVYTQPPRPKGRGHKIQKTPVHALAEAHNIEVRTPESLKKDEQTQKTFRHLDADIGVVAAYGLILPEAVLQAPRYGCLNIHASLLPRWRGAAPIQHAIWAGDSESGVTIMQMDAGLDTGAIITASSTAISDTTTAAELHEILADHGARLIVATLDKLADQGKLNATPQDEVQATYAPMLGRDDGRIDWTQPAQSIDRQYRALSPWPGIWTICGQGKRLKIRALKSSDYTPGEARPGTLLDKQGHVTCGQGCIRLETVQPDNAKPMNVAGTINGGYLQIDDVFV